MLQYQLQDQLLAWFADPSSITNGSRDKSLTSIQTILAIYTVKQQMEQKRIMQKLFSFHLS